MVIYICIHIYTHAEVHFYIITLILKKQLKGDVDSQHL